MADTPDIDIDAAVAEVAAGAPQALETWPQWDFCIGYDGRAYADLPVAAPDPDAAALTVGQIVALMNRLASQQGFAPLFGAASGRCPVAG